MSERVIAAFQALQALLAENSLCDMILDDSEGRIILLANPAGNLSIDNCSSGVFYLIWSNGQIEAGSQADPESHVPLPDSSELDALVARIES